MSFSDVVIKIDPSLEEAFHALATNEQERNFIAAAIDHRALGISTFRWEDMSWSEEEDPLIKRIMDFIRKVCEATDRSSAAPDAGFFSLNTGEGNEELKLGKWHELGLYDEVVEGMYPHNVAAAPRM